MYEIYRVETNIGGVVIAYSERRKKITSGRSTRDRVARKTLKKLRRGRGKKISYIRPLGLSRRSL